MHIKSKLDAGGPYKVGQGPGIASPWYWVEDKNGINVLRFDDRPGAVITTDKDAAEAICQEWNQLCAPAAGTPPR